jgi:hypothetical protein
MPALMIQYLLNVICKSQLKPVPESWLGAQGHGEGSVLRVRQLCSNLWSLLVLGIPQELRDSALTAAWHKVSIGSAFGLVGEMFWRPCRALTLWDLVRSGSG